VDAQRIMNPLSSVDTERLSLVFPERRLDFLASPGWVRTDV
jgi:hypothetical protein